MTDVPDKKTPPIVGPEGYTEPPAPATKEIQDMCDLLKPFVEEKTGVKYKTYTATVYRKRRLYTNVEDSSDYLIKVYVGELEYIHLMVLRIEEKTEYVLRIELKGVKDHQTIDSPLVPFKKLVPEPVPAVKH